MSPVIVFRIVIVAAIVGLSAPTTCLAQPAITRQPADFSVSLGANVTHTVLASSASTLGYQWRFNEVELTGATKVKSWKGFAYGIQASSNLLNWSLLTTLTNLTGTLQFADPGSANSSARFYRILAQP